MDLSKGLFSAAGLAVSGFGLAVLGATGLVIAGAIEQDKFNKSLSLTGNYSGQTIATIDALGRKLSDNTNLTVGAANQILAAIVATGRFGPALIEPLGTAVGALARTTGQSATDIVKDFENLNNGVVKFADEHDKQYHAIDITTRDHIRTLEESGKTEQAQLEYLQALTTHLGGPHVENLGYASQAWEYLGKKISQAKQAFLDYGKTADTTSRIATLQANIAQAETPKTAESVTAYSSAVPAVNPKLLTAYKAELANLLSDQIDDATDASLKANRALVQQQGKEGEDVVRSLVESTRTGSQKLDIELKKFYDGIAKSRESYKAKGLTDDQIDQKLFPNTNEDAVVAAIKKRYGDRESVKSDNKLANTERDYLQSIAKEDAAIVDATAEYINYGKAIDKSNVAKLQARIAPGGDLAGSSDSFRKKALAAATEADEDQQYQAGVKAHSTVQQRINDLTAQADAESKTARETAIAAALGEQARHIVKGQYDESTEQYKKDSAALVENTNRLQDQVAIRKQMGEDLGYSEQIKQLEEETALIGANSLARQVSTNTLKIQKQAEKDIQADPTRKDDITSSADANIARTNAAITSNYNALREFDTGAKTAFTNYVEDAQNAAKFSQTFFEGSFTKLEDIFVNFAKTGKLSFSDLFSYMSEEFIRQSVKINLSSLLKGNEGDLTTGISKIFGLLGGKSGSTGTTDNETTKLLRQQNGGTDPASSDLNDLFSKTSSTLSEFGSKLGDITKSGFDLFSSALSNVGSGLGDLTSSLSDAASNVADSISSFIDSLSSSGGSSSSGTSSGLADYFSSLFANGGIMTSSGPLPLETYATGGIANKPQVAVFGEGRMNEAYVPLPDGKSIPVSMRGGNSSASSGGSTNVVIENHNSSDVSVKKEKNSNGQEQLRVFVRAAKADVLNDIYGGGDLDKALTNKYGVNRAAGTPRRGGFN